MRVILLGSNGMLGSMMNFIGSQRSHISVLPISRSKFNALTDPPSKLQDYFTEECCIVNCIGAIPQKKYSEEDMLHLNSVFPQQLASVCHSANVPLIHVSTNCVFSGDRSDYTESDIPDANDVYGQSKAKGEPSTCVVLRCSIIGFETANTSFGLLEWFLHSQGTVQGFTDHFWNGLTTLELSKNIYELIDRKDFHPRIEHLSSANTLSKYDILVEAKRIFNHPVEIVPVTKGPKHYTLHSAFPKKTIQEQLADLQEIQKPYYRSCNPDVFVITSVINTGTNAWSYTSVRSVFSMQQRFEQTLKTIETIRDYLPNAIVLVSECSEIPSEMTVALTKTSDIFINCITIPEIQSACIQSNKKGYGELLQTRQALQALKERNVQFNRFFKISGRYWLTPHFRSEAFSQTEYSFNAMLPNATCHPTVLYSVPQNLIHHFTGIIDTCNEIYKHQIIGYETLLPPMCNPKISINGVGVAGYVAVDGNLYSTP